CLDVTTEMSAVVAPSSATVISNPVVDHFRCPALPPFAVRGNLSDSKGFFRFGVDAVCYGHVAGNTSPSVQERMFDASEHVTGEGGIVYVPFNIRQIVDNLRYERYVNGSAGHRWVEKSWVKNTYYKLRPMMRVSLRKHLQKIYLQGWD